MEKVDFTDPSIIARINYLWATKVMGWRFDWMPDDSYGQKKLLPIFWTGIGSGYYYDGDTLISEGPYSQGFKPHNCWEPDTNLNQLAMVVRQLGEIDLPPRQKYKLDKELWGQPIHVLDLAMVFEDAWTDVTKACIDAEIFTVAEIMEAITYEN